ncbi:RNA-dependent RNA polymerase [Beihai sphaeromadae virus 3]|uniref:RNA-dependent RNA polymerase n=1 Tax=Beihai sphaeromadae virus 3 TaxID=1922709 RepID=UPI00090AE4B7|nr:RNA-dependent RNA polymerase [Beihai sphaeromadae virus 3]APG76119.1 RNA-dependent RNA polymerase [Beihai sphaeromadae virus 3]APG76136.1 RNA-dependent RNA polymerase [Beihai sphaeromadae virus 3]
MESNVAITVRPNDIGHFFSLRSVASNSLKIGGICLLGVASYKICTSGWLEKCVEDLRHRIISRNKTVINDAGLVRATVQKKMELVSTRVRKGHSHSTAAAERNSATETMIEVVTANGFEPYVISPSPRESDLDGIRHFHSLADLRQDYRNDPLTDRHIIVMTDVDYYVNMHSIISLGRPILLYTFQPRVVSGPVIDGFFTITENIIHYRVNGGKDVKHPTWNYNQDTVFVRDPVTTFWATLRQTLFDVTGISWISAKMHRAFGIGPCGQQLTICTIDQFELSPNRNIVSIVPFARCRDNLLTATEYGTELSRTTYQQKSGVPVMNAITYIGDGDPLISLGEEGNCASVQLPLKDLESLRTAYHLSKTNNLSDTVRRSKRNDKEAAIIHRFLVSESELHPVEVHKPGQLARHYQSVEKDHDLDPTEQGKEYAREYAPGPLTQTAVFPSESISNERATIEGRINLPQAKAKAKESVTPRMRRIARDFVKHLVPEVGIGHPYSVSHVEEQQQKPLQRARNDANRFHDAFDMITKAFQKKEAYNAPNHPRNISTVPHGQNVKLSGFTYAFKESHLKHQEWYMPCNTPSKIASVVQKLAAESEQLVETDYSRFDGTFLRFMREQVEFASYKRWVHKDHIQELTDLLANEVDSKAVTRKGLKYQPDCTRLSGSALTTDGNSIANAFVSYAANRLDGMNDVEAWQRIGIVYGDDGLRDGTVSDDRLMSTASSLGFELKIINRATRGQPVSFLSRIYADPWSSPASVQTPSRTLLKIHTTCDTQSDIEEVGWAKTQAYLVTDCLTPFISNWCKAYQRNCTAKVINYKDFNDIPFWVRDEDALQNSWPQDNSEVWYDIVAQDLGVSVGELHRHLKLLDSYNGPIKDLPRLATALKTQPKLAVAMDGEIHAGPTEQNGQNPTSDQPASDGATKALPAVGGGKNQSGRTVSVRHQRNAHLRDQRPGSNNKTAGPGHKISTPNGGTSQSSARTNCAAGRRSAPQVGRKKTRKA